MAKRYFSKSFTVSGQWFGVILEQAEVAGEMTIVETYKAADEDEANYIGIRMVDNFQRKSLLTA